MSTIADKAMLINLSISVWTARKHDKRADKTVNDAFNATDSGRFSKVLIAEEAIKAVQATATTARTFHYTHTLPWLDDGWRLLPAKEFPEYSAEVRRLDAAFELSVDTFKANYDALVQDAKLRLNGLFNPADYPKSISAKFGFETNIRPVPVAGDFRVSLRSDETEAIQAAIEQRTQAALAAAHADLYRRLAEAIGHFADKMDTQNAIFRDSIIENLRELCELLPRLDITNDPTLNKIRREVEGKLLIHAPGDLRQNEAERASAGRDAAEILKAMEGMYNL